jgi:DNA polymerase-3 subunit alpha
MGLSQRAVEQAESGQGDIFGALSAVEPERLHLPHADPWTTSEKLMREFQALGFYFSAHPLDDYQSVLEKMRVQQYADFALAVKRGAKAGRLAGTVASKQIRRTRTGNKMGIFVLSDATGQYEVVMFSEVLQAYEDLMEPGKSVVLTVGAENREEGISLRANTVQRLDDEAASPEPRAAHLSARPEAGQKHHAHLKKKGDSPVSLIVIKGEGGGEVEIALPDTYQVSPPIAGAVKAIPGVVDVELV